MAENTKKMKVLILFGGESSEYEVSLKSVAYVIENIDRERFEVILLGINREGSCFLYEGPTQDIFDDKWEAHPSCKPAIISHDSKRRGLFLLDENKVLDVDIVFPVLHGQNGEDGRIQGMFELANMPFVGCGMLASASAMDKHHTKLVVDEGNVKQADYLVVRRVMFNQNPVEWVNEVDEYFEDRYPLFVKPARAGSSVGISKVKCVEELRPALELAFTIDRKVLVEEGIVGREIEVAVKGNVDIQCTGIGEITVGDFYSYDEKYKNDKKVTRFVDDLDETKVKEIQEAAEQIYKLVGCRGLSRVDFFLCPDGEIVFNEINTLPGFTSISMYPQLWEHEGIGATELISQLIDYGMENWEDWGGF